MTVTEFRLILLMLSKLPQAKEAKFDPLTPIYITKADMVEIGCAPKNVARDLKSACDNLRSRKIVIPTGVGDLHTSWLYNVLYFKSEIFQHLKEKYPTAKNDDEFINQLRLHNLLDTLPFIMKSDENLMARVVFHPDVFPYLIQLKNKFSQLELQELAKISSSFYSFRIFLLMLEWKDKGVVYKRIDDLRKEFGLQDKYHKFKDFRRWVIDTAVAEINKKTDWQVSYTLKKTGRKFTHIELKFHQKTIRVSKDKWLNFKMSEKQLAMFADKIATATGDNGEKVAERLADVCCQERYVEHLQELGFKPSAWYDDDEVKAMQARKVQAKADAQAKAAAEQADLAAAGQVYADLLQADDEVIKDFLTANQQFLTAGTEKYHFERCEYRLCLQAMKFRFERLQEFKRLDLSMI